MKHTTRFVLFAIAVGAALVTVPTRAMASGPPDLSVTPCRMDSVPISVVRAAPAIAVRDTIFRVTPHANVARVQRDVGKPIVATTLLLFALPFLMGSVNDTVSSDKSSNFAYDTVRAQLAKLTHDFAYYTLHHPAWQVSTAAVAPPVLATATTTTQIKSTATTQLMVNGVLTSLTATDPLLLAADIAAGDPNTLAIGSVRRWQVCWDATNATTKITCRPSNDQVIANYSTAALALNACRWPSLPPAGTVIVGLVDITNVTNVFTPGTTLLGAAGVTAACHDGPDANCFLASPVSP